MSLATTRSSGVAQHARMPPQRPTLVLMCVCVLTLQSLVAAINLAIAKLSASSLHPSSSQMLWIVDAYVIVFAGLLIPAGALGDRLGRKGLLLLGIGVFCAGAAMSAAASGVAVLIAGRGLAGAGAALVMPASMSVLLHVVPAERRPSAIASWSAAVAIGGIVGNAGGAVILQYFSWRVLFWVYVPVSLVLLSVVALVTPRTRRNPASLDLVGSVLLVLGLVPLLFSIIEGPELGWGSVPVLGGFTATVVLLTAFTRYELRTAHPLLDPRLFKLPRLRSGTVGVGASFFGMFALFYVNAQFLQYVKGFSPLQTGLAIVPMAVGMMVVTQASVSWARRIGARTTIGIGLLLLVVGLLLLSTATRATPYLLYTVYLMVMALGVGMAMPSLSAGVVSSLPQHQAGVGSGLNSAARELGAALGIATIGTVLSIRFTDQLPSALAGHVHSASAALAEAAKHGAALHSEVVVDFANAVAVGYRVTAGLLFVLAVIAFSGFGARRTAR
jgi:EmrB/QacA subfamily drug resistance transporter